MNYTPGLKSLVRSKISVATSLFGVKVHVYAPVDDLGSAFQNYGDLKYGSSPIFNGKLLIPRLLVKRSPNAYTNFDFVEDESLAYSLALFPRFSKVILNERNELSSFIIDDTIETEDVQLGNIYYKYSLIPSSELLSRGRTSNSEQVINFEENEIVSDPVFTSSIKENNATSDEPSSGKIKYGKL